MLALNHFISAGNSISMAKMSRMIMDKIVPYCEVWIDKVKFLIFVANLSFIKINRWRQELNFISYLI